MCHTGFLHDIIGTGSNKKEHACGLSNFLGTSEGRHTQTTKRQRSCSKPGGTESATKYRACTPTSTAHLVRLAPALAAHSDLLLLPHSALLSSPQPQQHHTNPKHQTQIAPRTSCVWLLRSLRTATCSFSTTALFLAARNALQTLNTRPKHHSAPREPGSCARCAQRAAPSPPPPPPKASTN